MHLVIELQFFMSQLIPKGYVMGPTGHLPLMAILHTEMSSSTGPPTPLPLPVFSWTKMNNLIKVGYEKYYIHVMPSSLHHWESTTLLPCPLRCYCTGQLHWATVT